MPVDPHAFLSHKANKSKEYAVQLYLYYQGQLSRPGINLYVAKAHWDKRKRKVKADHPHAELYNNYIKKKISDVKAYVLRAELSGDTLTVDDLALYVTGKKKIHNSKELYRWIEQQLQVEYAQLPGMLEQSTRALNKLKVFAPRLIPQQLNLNFIKQFYNHLKEKGYADSTTNKTITFIRNITDMMYDQQMIDRNPFIRYRNPPTRDKKPALPMSGEQITALQLYRASNPKRDQARDIVLWMLYCAGARIGDAAFARIEDIQVVVNPQGQTLHYWQYATRKSVGAKTRRVLRVLLPAPALVLYEKYRAGRSEGFLFPYLPDWAVNNHDRRNVKQLLRVESRINTLLKKIGKELGFSRLSCHMARYTYLRLMRQAGFTLDDSRDALGHNSITTTEIYEARDQVTHVDTPATIWK